MDIVTFLSHGIHQLSRCSRVGARWVRVFVKGKIYRWNASGVESYDFITIGCFSLWPLAGFLLVCLNSYVLRNYGFGFGLETLCLRAALAQFIVDAAVEALGCSMLWTSANWFGASRFLGFLASGTLAIANLARIGPHMSVDYSAALARRRSMRWRQRWRRIEQLVLFNFCRLIRWLNSVWRRVMFLRKVIIVLRLKVAMQKLLMISAHVQNRNHFVRGNIVKGSLMLLVLNEALIYLE